MYMMYLKHIHPSPNSSHNLSFCLPHPFPLSFEISSSCLPPTLSWEWNMGMSVVVTAIQKMDSPPRTGVGFHAHLPASVLGF